MTVRVPVRIIGQMKLTKGKVLVKELCFGVRRINGIIIPDDDASEKGIRSRWAKVYQVSEEITDLKPGDYVLLKHGRWTRKIPIILNEEDLDVWMIDYPDAVLLKTDEEPNEMKQTSKTL